MADRCSTCDLEYQPLEGDTWAFMYLSTAFLTGLIIVGMLLVAPSVLWLGRVVVTVIAVFLIGFSLPHRKGLAVALDFVVSEKVEPRGGD